MAWAEMGFFYISIHFWMLAAVYVNASESGQMKTSDTYEKSRNLIRKNPKMFAQKSWNLA